MDLQSDVIATAVAGGVGTLFVAFAVAAVVKLRRRRQAEFAETVSEDDDDDLQPAAEASAEPAPAETPLRLVPEPEPEPEPEVAPEAPRAQLRVVEAPEHRAEVEALRGGLKKTHEGFIAKLNGLFRGRELSPALLEELEALLLSADVGVRTATALLDLVKQRLSRRDLGDSEAVQAAIRTQMSEILRTAAGNNNGKAGALRYGDDLTVWMVVGVNGVGKTTSIGKLAVQQKALGRKVLLGAGDTFRAAAVDQLKIWSERAGVDFASGQEGQDPSSVLFDAVGAARARGCDLVIADTAGRLHTKTNLMEELKKVKRVLAKACPGAPHEILLVVDATTGQNAIQQAKQFHESVGVTGVVLTKLDGTAKGGIVIGVSDTIHVPIRFIGVGEKPADLRAFDVDAFVEALFE